MKEQYAEVNLQYLLTIDDLVDKSLWNFEL